MVGILGNIVLVGILGNIAIANVEDGEGPAYAGEEDEYPASESDGGRREIEEDEESEDEDTDLVVLDPEHVSILILRDKTINTFALHCSLSRS